MIVVTAPDTPNRWSSGFRALLVILVLITVVLVAGLLLRRAPASSVLPVPTGTTSPFDATAAASEVWQLLNGARIDHGLPPLTRNDTLVSIACWRSQDMVQRSYFSHTILGTSFQVFHWYDLDGLKYSFGSESIAWNNGYSDADSPIAAHNGRMASPPDEANILNPAFTEAGVGAYGADNVMFLGKIRSPRMYTLLFLEPEPSPGL
jgi:uncharacterized protein YkwD